MVRKQLEQVLSSVFEPKGARGRTLNGPWPVPMVALRAKSVHYMFLSGLIIVEMKCALMCSSASGSSELAAPCQNKEAASNVLIEQTDQHHED